MIGTGNRKFGFGDREQVSLISEKRAKHINSLSISLFIDIHIRSQRKRNCWFEKTDGLKCEANQTGDDSSENSTYS